MRLALEYVEQARAQHADLVALPELALPGYPPEDLLLKPAFIRDNRAALDEVVAASTGIVVVVGFVDAVARSASTTPPPSPTMAALSTSTTS